MLLLVAPDRATRLHQSKLHLNAHILSLCGYRRAGDPHLATGRSLHPHLNRASGMPLTIKGSGEFAPLALPSLPFSEPLSEAHERLIIVASSAPTSHCAPIVIFNVRNRTWYFQNIVVRSVVIYASRPRGSPSVFWILIEFCEVVG